MARTRELKSRDLRWRCPLKSFEFTDTSAIEGVPGPIGQDRAVAAIEFGADIASEGYNVFVTGISGTGRSSTTRTELERRAASMPVPDDWCYVYNFDDAHQPRALRLPAGMGLAFRDDMARMLNDMRQVLGNVFESDEYNDKRDAIIKEFRQERNTELQAFEQEAQEAGFALGRSPAGLIVAPAVEGEVMTPQQYGELSDEERQRLDAKREELQGKLGEIMRRGQRDEKETRERVRQLDQEVAHEAVDPVFEDLREKYSAVSGVLEHLERMEKDLIENIGMLRRDDDDGLPPGLPPQLMMGMQQKNPLERYEVNVLVTNDPENGAPIIEEANPTLDKLTGEIEHQAQMGALVTDFSMIKAGALHHANGGFLIIEALQLLLRPFAWEALKRALRNKHVRIESLSDQYRFVSTVTLEPEPVPLDVKVVLIGNPFIYYLLYEHDEDFGKLFKVQADFSTEIDRDDDALQQYVQFIAHVAQRDGLLPFERSAVARIIEQGAELAGDQQKLTVRLLDIADMLRESSYWAQKSRRKKVKAQDVAYALQQRIWRANRIEELIFDMIHEGAIMVNVDGAVAGQINGLSIMQLGDYMIGRPGRLTCRTFTGRTGIIQIDREAKLTGRLHDKGMLTLSGFLGDRFGRTEQIQLSATLSFEQLYSELEGDSASSTELYCLLSSLADAPIKQGIAVTGSVNQMGEVQAIGGVSRKIEGFYRTCKILGLTGEQGVIIPESNVRHLMLQQEVVDAVKAGQFHIWSVRTIDEGIEILTGIPAGQADKQGEFPPDTINGRVQARLRQITNALRDEHRRDDDGDDEEDDQPTKPLSDQGQPPHEETRRR
ncbi:MAG: AAA family ATPase [Armatimonadetes bacterium]|nr:AAA family ATPase [Armatimonadota bacterium]